MRYLGLLAFGVTVGVLTPLIRPDAGPDQAKKLIAANETELDVNGAHVKIAMQHPLAEEGGKVRVTLTATKNVTVGLVVMGSSGTEGSRVPEPPIAVGDKLVELQANKPKDVDLRLTGAKHGYSDDGFGQYTIYVAGERAATRLATLSKKAGPNIPTGEIPDQDSDTSKLYSVLSSIGSNQVPEGKANAVFQPNSVARLDAFTTKKSDEIRLKVPDTASRGQEFTVAVTVENPKGKTLKGLKLTLDMPRIGDYVGIEDKAVMIDQPMTIDLKPHETKVVKMKVTSSLVGLVGLRASIDCGDGGCEKGTYIRGSTFDAVEIVDPAVARL